MLRRNRRYSLDSVVVGTEEWSLLNVQCVCLHAEGAKGFPLNYLSAVYIRNELFPDVKIVGLNGPELHTHPFPAACDNVMGPTTTGFVSATGFHQFLATL